ncbi:hypothetical protein AJ80_03054 [Polytolypa hystricis UAMH7299]|uniref:Uncharacterized protein n=1 Tax=Polytolypa hystricis (strain UAMH7299) TaxID=1447883 RepID=A0A2B7YKN4_POLH7|nr:hypothetical protein AJ80_03054 [Polytolypa hystricis UAMH7299]
MYRLSRSTRLESLRGRPVQATSSLWQQPKRRSSTIPAEPRDLQKLHIHPNPSEFMRYTLFNTTRTPAHQNDELDGKLGLYFHTDTFMPDWRPPNKHSQFDPEWLGDKDISRSFSLRSLQAAVEKNINSLDAVRNLNEKERNDVLVNAIRGCEDDAQYADILATISGIVPRVLQQGVESPGSIVAILGMQYAVMSWSAVALRRYGAFFVSKLSFPVAKSLLARLSGFSQRRIWEDPMADMAPMLEVVTGLDANGLPLPMGQSLFSLLDMAPGSEGDQITHGYIKLLRQMGDKRRLPAMRSTLTSRLNPESSPALPVHIISHYCHALVESGSGQTAIDVAKEASSYHDLNAAFPLSLWKDLINCDETGALAEVIDQQTTMKLLDLEMCSIEKRLGATWSEEDGNHVRASDVDIWSHHDLEGTEPPTLTLSSDVSSHTNTQRFVEEITCLGSSKSRTNLSMVTDLLDENEGLEIPLGSRQSETSEVLEYAWFPQSSPIEFSNDPMPLRREMDSPLPSSSLGLLRLRPECDGSPRKTGNAFYFMQLGYLGVKPCAEAQTDTERWTRTGDVICWDRKNQRFVILAVGTDTVSLPTTSPLRRHLSGSVIDMTAASGGNADFISLLMPLNVDPSYYLIDVDPALDLQR